MIMGVEIMVSNYNLINLLAIGVRASVWNAVANKRGGKKISLKVALFI